MVGAGPVGLTAALLLLRLGVPVTVLERHREPYPLPRAVHLDDEAVDVLRVAGVLDGFRAISRPMPGLRLVDARDRVLAEFPRAAVGRFGHAEASLFHQPDLDALLEGALPDGVLRRGVAVVGVEPGPVVVCEGGERVAASAVLACDGADSAVRRSVGIGVRELGRPRRWVVVDAESEDRLPMWEGVHQVCAPVPGTYLRVTGNRYRFERRADGTVDLPDGLRIVRRAEYVFHARVAERWREDRVFLLGDAAHLTPPFVGQGLGAGLRDAANLAWKLERVLLRSAPERLLDTYQSERLPHAVTTIRTAMLLGWAMTGGRARQLLLRAAGKLPIAAVAPKLRRGPLVRRGGGRVLPGFTEKDFATAGNALVRPDGVIAATAPRGVRAVRAEMAPEGPGGPGPSG